MDDMEKRIKAQKKWAIWRYDKELGTVEWAGGMIHTQGVRRDLLDKLLISMGEGMSQEELFRSLPDRLTGHIYVEFPED
jgi:hypothetical protein